MNSYFTTDELVPLITGLILVFASVITFQYREKKTAALILLLLGAFGVRFFMALLDPYLNVWDEQFHALVAKNMMSDPFHPMLYEHPVLPYDKFIWIENHTWLHKQPLFLWQMALSMKIFGVNLIALRLPSMLMSTAVVFFIFRIGKITVNQTVGYFAALLFALSNFTLEITAGVINTDHNDVAFLFYVCASVWAWIEYENCEGRRKKYFLILIGLFSGCAILVKWLTGLLVFSGWGLAVILSKERRKEWKHYRDILISLLVAVAVFLPWQLYILSAFPELSRHEYAYSSRHFFEVIEGHGGDYWWHFDIAKELYGVGILIVLPAVILLGIAMKKKIHKIAVLAYIIAIYLFFTLAATKMIAFTYCISFLIFLAFGVLLEWFFKLLILNPEYVKKRIYSVAYMTLILMIISSYNLDIEKIQERHTMWKRDESSFLYRHTHNAAVISRLDQDLDNMNKSVVFNCEREDYTSVMFFTDVVAAYPDIPEENTLSKLKDQGYQIAVFDNGQLPAYLANDDDVVKVSGYLK